RIADVLEQLTGNDHVEARIRKRERLVDVGPVRLDAELRRLLEGFAVDVHADDVVSLRIGPRQRAVAAAEVEDAPAGAADVAAEELDALLSGEDELLATRAAMVLAVLLVELLEPRHCSNRGRPTVRASATRRPSASSAAEASTQTRKSHGTR